MSARDEISAIQGVHAWETEAWAELEAHAKAVGDTHLRDLLQVSVLPLVGADSARERGQRWALGPSTVPFRPACGATARGMRCGRAQPGSGSS